MMDFSKETIEKIRKEMNDVLTRYGVHNDIEFEVGRITYDHNSFRTTLKALNTGNGIDPRKLEYEKNCYKFGAEPSWFGKQVFVNGEYYTVTEIKPRARKYPIILTPVSGTQGKKAGVDYVRRLINAEPEMKMF
jgi:hypothetical protein